MQMRSTIYIARALLSHRPRLIMCVSFFNNAAPYSTRGVACGPLYICSAHSSFTQQDLSYVSLSSVPQHPTALFGGKNKEQGQTWSLCVAKSTANPTWGDIFECCFKAQSSKLERLFCHVSVKRDVRALSFKLYKSFRKCHPT